MKATVVLLPTIEEQIAGGDTLVIDPNRVTISDQNLIVFAGFSYNMPRDYLGRTERIWVEDGRLMAEVDLPSMNLGVAGSKEAYDEPFNLTHLGLTWVPRR